MEYIIYDFTSNIDSTYDVYVFKLYDIHPQTDNVNLEVNFRDGGSSFDAVKTTTMFRAFHNESSTTTGLEYRAGDDLAQSTANVRLTSFTGNDNDQSSVGTLTLYNPSSTTFVKHFMATMHEAVESDYAQVYYDAGYCNTTNAIDGVRFQFNSGNIDSGVIKLYGIS